MKILTFTGEKYYKSKDGEYYSDSDSYKFIDNTYGVDNVKIIAGIKLANISSNKEKINKDRVSYEIPFFKNNLEVLLYILNPFKYFKLMSIFNRIIQDNKNTIFWVRNPALISILFSKCLMKKNRKFISHFCADVHGISKSKYKGILKYISLFIEKLILKQMSIINNYDKALVFSTGAVLCERYSSSTHLIDLVLPKDLDKLKPKTNNNNGHDYFLYVGRIQKDKGIFDLLEAFKYINNNIKKLLIAGDGPDVDKLKSFIIDNSLDEKVMFLGRLNKKELSNYYTNCFAVIIPSNNSYEGFPRVILEAWNHNKPVIVTKLPGIMTLAKNEKNCLFIDNIKPKTILTALEHIQNINLYTLLLTNIINDHQITEPSYWQNIASNKTYDFFKKD